MIRWSDHAILRVKQRYGFRKDILIPNKLIEREASKVLVGQDFDVTKNGITYGCKAIPEGALVKTVFGQYIQRVRDKDD